MMQTLLLATGNAGKVAELRSLLAEHRDFSEVKILTPANLDSPMPEVEESGATFAENARLKARSLAQASGLITLADDSGLCVDALEGAPGIHSARWTGPTDGDRTQALLQRLAAVPHATRTARFVCAVCAAAPNGALSEAEGVCEGLISDGPRGSCGFGYDPVFLLSPFGRTMAELSSEEKNRVSHRARAIAAVLPGLRDLLREFSGG